MVTYARNLHSAHRAHGLKHGQELIFTGGDGRRGCDFEIVGLQTEKMGQQE